MTLILVNQRRIVTRLEVARRRMQKLAARLAKRNRQERRCEYRRLQRERDRLGRARWVWQRRGGNHRKYPILRGWR